MERSEMFTKGPWEREGSIIQISNRGIIAICPTVEKQGVFEWLDNARLISASPDLLEELESNMLLLRNIWDKIEIVPEEPELMVRSLQIIAGYLAPYFVNGFHSKALAQARGENETPL